MTRLQRSSPHRAWPAPILTAGVTLLAGIAVHAAPTTLDQALRQAPSWYATDEAQRLADHVLSWQSDPGSWPKGVNTLAAPASRGSDVPRGTFDNGATRRELRFLARVYQAGGQPRHRDSFLRGLDTILAAQYPTGGWPQSFPLSKGYARHITFNDDTMIGLMKLLREIAVEDTYVFVDPQRRAAAQAAVDRGVQCILRCQIRIGGRLTVWCAQHDAVTFEPRPARSYELESLSGAESSAILLFLMSLEDPSPEVISAVHAGAQWYESVQIKGIRQVRVDGDKRIVPDPDASPLWARFYDLQTQHPFFCGRDGIKKPRLADIEAERRNGYAWYGEWGRQVLKQYELWRPAHLPPAR